MAEKAGPSLTGISNQKSSSGLKAHFGVRSIRRSNCNACADIKAKTRRESRWTRGVNARRPSILDILVSHQSRCRVVSEDRT